MEEKTRNEILSMPSDGEVKSLGTNPVVRKFPLGLRMGSLITETHRAGHDVPELVVRRRFDRSTKLLALLSGVGGPQANPVGPQHIQEQAV